MTSQLKIGAAISYATVAFNTLSGLLYTPWMISCIGSDHYGLYTLALSVVNFFLLDFGLSSAVSRFLSKYYAEGKDELVPTFLGMTYKAYFIIDAVIFVILATIYLNIDLIYANLGSGQLPTYKTLFLVIFIYSVVAFPCITFNGILVSKEKFIAYNASVLLEKVLNVALIIVALSAGMDVFALVVVNAFTSVVFSGVRYVCCRRAGVKADLLAWNKHMLNEILSFSLWVTVGQICQRFIFSVMPSIIAITSDTWEVAVFGLASSLEGYVWTVANALNGMFMPKVSRALVSDNPNELQELMVRLGRLQLFVIGFIVVCFLPLGQLFIDCWVGPDYETLWACAILAIAPGIVELPQLIGETAIVASGEVRAKGILYIAMAVANVVLGFVLTPRFGALGGCASIFVAYCLRTAGKNYIYKMRLGLRLRDFFRRTYLRWIPVAAATLLVASVFSNLLPLSGWLLFFASVCVVAMFYAALTWKLVLNDYEKGLLTGLFRRQRAK